MAYPLNIKNYQESKLGDAQGTPSSSSTIIRSSSLNFVLSLYILRAMLGASFLLSVLFVCLLVISLLDPSFICVGERHAPFFYLNNPLLRLYLVEYS